MALHPCLAWRRIEAMPEGPAKEAEKQVFRKDMEALATCVVWAHYAVAAAVLLLAGCLAWSLWYAVTGG